MSKYIITVKEELEDGTKRPFFFDEENTERKIKADGFVILGINDDGKGHAKNTTYAFHNVSSLMLAESMKDSKILTEAITKLVGALLENRYHYLTEDEEDDDAAD